VSARYAMRTRSTTVDGRWVWMRLHSKKALKRAMRESEAAHREDASVPDCSSIPKLAQAAGLSIALVGFLVGEGKSARWTTTVPNALAIAGALRYDVDELFGEREDGQRVA
jgi:hypothetical protein